MGEPQATRDVSAVLAATLADITRASAELPMSDELMERVLAGNRIRISGQGSYDRTQYVLSCVGAAAEYAEMLESSGVDQEVAERFAAADMVTAAAVVIGIMRRRHLGLGTDPARFALAAYGAAKVADDLMEFFNGPQKTR